MENQQLVSPSQQCTSTPVGFGQGRFSKEQWRLHRSTLLTSLTWLQLIFICSVD
jgi:hypothetical protein